MSVCDQNMGQGKKGGIHRHQNDGEISKKYQPSVGKVQSCSVDAVSASYRPIPSAGDRVAAENIGEKRCNGISYHYSTENPYGVAECRNRKCLVVKDKDRYLGQSNPYCVNGCFHNNELWQYGSQHGNLK